MVGVAGFEPTAPTPPAWCATRLRYTPMKILINDLGRSFKIIPAKAHIDSLIRHAPYGRKTFKKPARPAGNPEQSSSACSP